MTPATDPVTVFLPTWNAGPRLEAVLEALRGQHTAREVRIRATDSGSTDGTLQVLARHGVPVRSIPQSAFGHGRTRNEAVLAADTELVVLLTQDARPANEDWLERLVAPFEDPSVAGAWSRQVPRPGAHPFVLANLAQHVGSAARHLVVEPVTPAAWAALAPTERIARLGFDDVSSCVRRAVVRATPIPDVAFAEDMAFARAALLAGHRLVFATDSVVEHSHDFTCHEIDARVALTHAARRRLADHDPLPTRLSVARATWRSARFLARAALRAPEAPLPARLAAFVQALPTAWIQSRATRRGARSVGYEAPSG